MSWHYSQGQEVDFSLPDYLDSIRLQRVKSLASHEKSLCNDNETESWTNFQSGMMSEHSTDDPGKDLLMSSQVDFRVKILVSQAKVKDLPESVQVFGSSIKDLLKKLSLRLCSRKTVRSCARVDSPQFSKSLTAWGMMQDGVFWELGTSARYTKEIESGFLPTISATEWKGACSRRFVGSEHYRAARMAEGLRRGKDCPAYIHPDFAEVQMLWPITWTESKPLETDKFHSWLRLHGIY